MSDKKKPQGERSPKKPNKPVEKPESSGQKVDNATPSNQKEKIETEPPYLVHRSKEGLKLISSFQEGSICKNRESLWDTIGDNNNRVECVCSSEDGSLLAWCDNNVIKCINWNSRDVVFEQPNAQRSNCMFISPKSTKLVCYSNMSGGDNLHFWDIPSQTLLASMPFRKASQWKPTFSMNEDICIQHVKNELLFYIGGTFDKPKKRISHIKVNDFSLSTASFHNSTYQNIYLKRTKNKAHYVAVYTAGTNCQPSIVKIYKYPNMTDAITNKSFFRADRVEFSWSPSGESLLLTCQADFDPSNKSYYGEQTLNFLNIKGDSYFVKLPKEGTISHKEWYPSCDKDMFVCVYGAMPAKVSLFNNKCEVIFNFDDQGSSFNAATFSPFGNLLAVYGFGNLAGQLCIWDFDKKKLVAKMKVPETTYLEWCPDGRHILTCTTAPRLRVSNGFRIWHYTGSLLYEDICNDPNLKVEVYDVLWQVKPGQYKKPKCDSKPSQLPNLMTQSKISKFQGAAGKYIPPSMRNKV